jgi:hypothetical protein
MIFEITIFVEITIFEISDLGNNNNVRKTDLRKMQAANRILRAA